MSTIEELEQFLTVLYYGGIASILSLVLLVIHMAFQRGKRRPTLRRSYNIGLLRKALEGLPDESYITDFNTFYDVQESMIRRSEREDYRYE